MGADRLRAPIIDAAGVDVFPPSTIDSVPIDRKIPNESGTQSVVPYMDFDALVL